MWKKPKRGKWEVKVGDCYCVAAPKLYDLKVRVGTRRNFLVCSGKICSTKRQMAKGEEWLAVCGWC